MFGKKECGNCGKKSSSKYRFCPSCGNPLGKKAKKEDYGMLGNDDFMNEVNQFSNSFLGGVGGKVMGKMLENTMKMLEKEIKKEMGKNNMNSNLSYGLSINGDKVNLNYGPEKNVKERKQRKAKKLPSGELKNFSSLKKVVPKTNVRRFSDKVVYEIEFPGVKSEKDISIVKLENSIEIKAAAKNSAYKKVIPVNFPVTDYNFSGGKLILELGITE